MMRDLILIKIVVRFYFWTNWNVVYYDLWALNPDTMPFFHVSIGYHSDTLVPLGISVGCFIRWYHHFHLYTKERTRNRLAKETEFRIKIFEFYFFYKISPLLTPGSFGSLEVKSQPKNGPVLMHWHDANLCANFITRLKDSKNFKKCCILILKLWNIYILRF